MYYITNLVSHKCNFINDKIHIQEDNPCRITNLAIASIATLSIGSITFCAIFFTTSLLTPSIVASVSIVVLISEIDIALVICLKKKQSDKEIEEQGNEESSEISKQIEELRLQIEELNSLVKEQRKINQPG